MMAEDTETAPKWRDGEGMRMILFSQTQGLLALFWVNADRSRRGRPSSPLPFSDIDRAGRGRRFPVTFHVAAAGLRNKLVLASKDHARRYRFVAWGRRACAERGTTHVATTVWRPNFGGGFDIPIVVYLLSFLDIPKSAGRP